MSGIRYTASTMKKIFSQLTATAVISAAFILAGSSVALAAETTRPSVGMVTPVSATAGQQVTLSVSASDASGIASCFLYVEFQDEGSMNVSADTASKVYTFPSQGVYTVFVHCKDVFGNAANGHNTAVVVSAASGSSDHIAPTVGTISPVTVQKNVATNLNVSYADAGGVTSCRLIVDGFDNGSMDLSAGVATRSFTFDSTGEFSVYARCADASGNATNGATVSVVVSDIDVVPVDPEEPVAPVVTPGLVKIGCPAIAPADHTCHAVYYRSGDGKRHAFPNERVFLTWYADFSTVQHINATEMAALPLGRNVTYRPGVRMVKFTTDNKVYAVGRAGELRWVSSETAAIALYGADWNKKIDDVADTFFGNYTRGTVIANPSDYSPAVELAEASTLETNF